MATQSTFKKCRDGLQQGIYAVINPFVRLMIRMGITPNIVTTIGLLGNLAAAVIFGYAGYQCEAGEFSQWWLITLAGAVIIGFSLFDMLDGQVARLGNMVSRFGALYDSVLDRYCELFTVGGIAYFMFAAGYKLSA
ncbi:MAG: CDP-alcohol phosphatidyltransferase family protein, partial [Muribaculaceae bacterium]